MAQSTAAPRMKPLVKFELVAALVSFALIFVAGVGGHIAVVRCGFRSRATKMSKPALDAFQHDAQKQLLDAGWMPGHLVAHSEHSVHLWGRQRTAGGGRYWLKGNTVLILERNRMDAGKRYEPPGSGEFIAAVHICVRENDPRLVFEPSAWTP